MQNRKWIIRFFIALGLLLLLETYIYVNYSKNEVQPVKITFLQDGENSTDYENMKAGAENAAVDSNYIIDFVSVSKEDSVSSENKLYVVNHNLIFEDGTKMVDEAAMASDLGQYVAENSECSKVLLVSSGTKDYLEDIIDSLMASISTSGLKVEYRPLSPDSKKLRQSMYNLEQSGLFDCVIGLDRESISAAVEANNRTSKFVKLYGVDNSSESVYYLDTGEIEALAYMDEYSMGYIAVKQLLKDKNIDKIADEQNFYYIAERQSMYSKEMESVLFPFVK